MSSRHTPPRLGFRVPAPPPPRDPATEGEDDSGLRPGDLLDARYQIEDRIGEGGVGVVYRALQLKLHRRVAIKVLSEESDEEQRPRFEREAITLAALSHPNIVSVQDYGHTRGKPFLVMELLTGRTLREVIDAEGALAVPRALSLTREVLHALAYAHELGIVHRDLKPANLLVQALPSHEHVKVLDFGFVKLLPGSYLDRGVQLSRVGFTFGTPAYMSPEHATGGNTDGRSDLYSLGVLLFEMLTGHKPFEGELPDLIRHHLSTPVPWLTSRRPELAGRDDLQALIERSMAKVREERFANASEFLQAIDAILLAAAPATLAVSGASHAKPVGMALEVRTLGRALQQFFAASAGIVKEKSGSLVERALAGRQARLSEGARRASAEIHARTVALLLWTKPQLARAQAELSRLLQQVQARFNSNVADGAKRPPAVAAPALPEPVATKRKASPVATIVLDDPTHAVDVPMPPPTSTSARRRRAAR